MADPALPEELGEIPFELRVLVAGHRAERLGHHADTVRDCLRSVLETIKAAAQKCRPDCDLSLLVGLEEGTEGLARSIASESGYALSIVAHSRLTSVPEGAVRAVTFGYDGTTHGRQQLGRAVTERDHTALGFSDLVVLVWDGRRTSDSTEGTALILREALLAQKFVVWIKPGVRPTVMATSLERLAQVDSLNLPPNPDPHRLVESFVPLDGSDDLDDIVRVLLSPEAPYTVGRLFRSLPARRRRPGLADRWARALVLVGRESRRQLVYVPRDSQPLWTSDASCRRSEFDLWFRTADVDANLVAGDYRSRTWALYLLGALAVALGSIGIVYGGGFGLNRELGISAELVTVLAIGLMVFGFAGQDLHLRWPALRSLAENLRYQYFVYHLAGVISPLRRPLWQLDEGGAVLRDPIAWVVHRLNVAVGLPTIPHSGVLDVAAALQDRRYVSELIRLLTEQSEYHRRRSRVEAKVRDRLRRLSFLLFVSTVSAVACRFGLTWRPLDVCVVSLPAFAAA
ncbi:MAG TPA: hypothetical protein VGR90_07345, partial [Acidimicrobiales bacterium]|nr:hypothetical protein [Acidimicrobiales bacterium]